MLLKCGGRHLDLSKPAVMAILNVTPDSFSDGGEHFENGSLSLDSVLRRVEQLVEAGADIIDIGGESTRPGAQSISAQEEIDRVVPVIDAITKRFDVITSVDTSNAAVMSASVGVGVGLINDVRALRRAGALEVVASSGLPVCLMHMRGEPGSMQQMTDYDDIVSEVKAFLGARVQVAKQAGIADEQIILDPGYGFAKTAEQNLTLLAHQHQLLALGYPLLAGLSRKSMMGQLLGREISQRLAGSLALALLAVQHGASIIRVHDVAETVDVLRILDAVNNGSS